MSQELNISLKLYLAKWFLTFSWKQPQLEVKINALLNNFGFFIAPVPPSTLRAKSVIICSCLLASVSLLHPSNLHITQSPVKHNSRCCVLLIKKLKVNVMNKALNYSPQIYSISIAFHSKRTHKTSLIVCNCTSVKRQHHTPGSDSSDIIQS